MIDTAIAIVLAGGEARRMSHKDKPLQLLHGRPLIAHVLERIQPLVAASVISVNREGPDYSRFGLPCVADIPVPENSPLVGIASAMNWYVQHGYRKEHVLVVPADVPRFPPQTLSLLQAGMRQAEASCACVEAAGRLQPLFSLWSLDLATTLLREVSRGNLGVAYVLKKYKAATVSIIPGDPTDFVNVNTEAQLAALARIIHELP